jgi:ribonuclease P protein component
VPERLRYPPENTMPPSIGRLKRRAEFLAVAASNRKWVAPCLVVQILAPIPAGQEKPLSFSGLRLGFTASRKVGNAVQRNRARRRLKAAASEVLAGLKTAPADLVLIARKATVTCRYPDLTAELLRGLKKLGIVAP